MNKIYIIILLLVLFVVLYGNLWEKFEEKIIDKNIVDNTTTDMGNSSKKIYPTTGDPNQVSPTPTSKTPEPESTVYPWDENNGYGFAEILDDGANGNNGLNHNMCSPACCSKQYPLPFKLGIDEMTMKSNQKFVPNNYTCNNSMQNTGCVCMTKQQHDNLGTRGKNFIL